MAKETVKVTAEVEAVETVKAETATEKAEKKTVTKKATAAKKTTKKAETATEKAEKKTATKKATTTKKTTKKDAKVEMFLQYNDNQLDEVALLERVNADCKEQGVEVTELKLYLKPQDNACYYVANGSFAGKVDLF